MVNYSDKVDFIVEWTAITRNFYAKQVQLGKMSQEVAQHKLNVMEAILGDYSRKKYVTLAGVLSGDTYFQIYAGQELGLYRQATKPEATDYLRKFCGITSRRDLAIKKEARHKFDELKQMFKDWKKYHER